MKALAADWTDGSAAFPLPSDLAAMAARWEQWDAAAASCGDPEVRSFAESASGQPVVKSCLDAVFGNSPFLSHNLLFNPGLVRRIFADGPGPVIEDCIRDVRDPHRLGSETRAELMARLRSAKSSVATAAAIADIGLGAPVMQVTGWLSELASATLHASCCHLLRELYERGKAELADPCHPAPDSGLIVLGMGKLGAGELNYSSDVDVIILFDDDAACIPAGNQQRLFSQLARNLVTVMAKRTAEGYVFRTDLRLRPDPGTTPPAVSVARAVRYYRTIAQTWERAAMIKARPIAGDLAAGQRFLEANAGFVWRKNLDFPALRDIQAIKRKINAHKGSGDIAVEGHNVKLGRGGIREIEFLTQTRQLIWGGQNRELRGRGTIEMLNSLAVAGRISAGAASELQDAYLFLRRVEHRIQMVNDQQTHSLPGDREGTDRIAAFLGFRGAAGFRKSLLKHLRTVESHYNSMFEDSPAAGRDIRLNFAAQEATGETAETLEAMGFADGRAVCLKVREWLVGNIRATQTHRSRTILNDIADPLIKAFAATSDPGRTFDQFDSLLGRLSRSINLFSAMAAEPSLLRLVAEIMGSAPRLADWISQQPSLLEGVLQSDFQQLDPSLDADLEPEITEAARRGLVRLFYEREFRPKQMQADLAYRIETEAGSSPDLQSLLDAQRRWVRNRKFQIGIHMLRGDMTPTQASLPLCGIAEACLSSLLEYIKSEFSAVHGSIEGGKLAILACGRLGSREMTLSSDLDLIFVYSHAPNAGHSDGRKSLAPTQYYAKFCRRFLNGVTAPTAEGRLYEVDMRLRPSGKSGPIACSIERFENYQRKDAWTWEHQALTRARVVYAEGRLRRQLGTIIQSVLSQERDRGQLAGDIRSMRRRIRRELEDPAQPTIKYRRGGILDAEFIAQYLQLLHAASHPGILQRDACSVFTEAGQLGLIETDAAVELHRDLQFWRNLQGIMLLTAESDRLEGGAATVFRRTFGSQGGDFVQSTFADAMEETSERIARQYELIIR